MSPSPFRPMHVGVDPYNTVRSRLIYECVAHAWGCGLQPADAQRFIEYTLPVNDPGHYDYTELAALAHEDMDAEAAAFFAAEPSPPNGIDEFEAGLMDKQLAYDRQDEARGAA